MRIYGAHLNIESALRAPRRCAGCGTRQMVPAADDEQASFVCRACGLRWHAELGWLHVVDPTAATTQEQR